MNKKITSILAILVCGINLQALSLDEAIQKALLNNNTLKKQAYIYDEAKENVNFSKTTYNPVVNLGYTYSARDENADRMGKDYSNASAMISYNLFNGFTDKYNLKSAEDLQEYSKLIFDATKFDLILTVKQYYISYLKTLKNIDTKENAYKLLEQQFNDSKNRFNQGLLAKNDLLQVNTQMLQAKQDLAQAKADSKIARFQLKNSLGGQLNKDEEIEDLKKVEIKALDYDENSLDLRSEIKAINKTIDSIVNLKNANNGDFLPSADLNLGYTKFGEDAFLDTKNGVDDQNSVTLSLSWNLYNGGRDSIEDVIYQKKLLQAKEDLQNTKLSIQLQYEQALEEFNVSKLNYETATLSLSQAKENYKLVNNRFQEGLSSSTDLINANFLLSQAKQSFDTAYYDRFLAKATLDRIFEK